MQFQAVSDQLDTIEGWKADHNEAMACWATESKIGILVAIQDAIRRADAVLFGQVMSGQVSPEAPVLIELFEVSAKVGFLCRRLLAEAQSLIETGYAVNGYNVLQGFCAEPDGGLKTPAIIRDAREMESAFPRR
jgi:hypothetical protein